MNRYQYISFRCGYANPLPPRKYLWVAKFFAFLNWLNWPDSKLELHREKEVPTILKQYWGFKK